MTRLLLLTAWLAPVLLHAQGTVITWAYGSFGTPGDAAFTVDDHRIYQACGAYGQRGPCLYVIDGDQVYHAADAFGRRGACAFSFDGTKLVRAQGSNCTAASCALTMEGNKIFRGEGPFCDKREGAFLIEPGGDAAPTVIYLAEGPFASRSDAILEVRGPLDPIALLTILAGL